MKSNSIKVFKYSSADAPLVTQSSGCHFFSYLVALSAKTLSLSLLSTEDETCNTLLSPRLNTLTNNAPGGEPLQLACEAAGCNGCSVRHSLCDFVRQEVTQCVAPDDGQVPAALRTLFSSVRPTQLGWNDLETAGRLCMVHAVSGTVGRGWRSDTQAQTYRLVPPVARGSTFFLTSFLNHQAHCIKRIYATHTQCEP